MPIKYHYINRDETYLDLAEIMVYKKGQIPATLEEAIRLYGEEYSEYQIREAIRVANNWINS